MLLSYLEWLLQQCCESDWDQYTEENTEAFDFVE